MILLVISAVLSSFLLVALAYLALTWRSAVDDRLMEVAAQAPVRDASLDEYAPTGLAGLASVFTGMFKPIRDLVTSKNDDELAFQLSLAGFRKAEHVEVYASAKILLPVLAIILSSFAGSNMIPIALIGGAVAFFGPDFVVTQLIARRRANIGSAFPDALDLLVICMEAGLGIDQALVRVGEEMRLTSPPLADEIQIINREQRAGKPRTEAWRSFSDRLDLDFVRQFVSMLVQTERFGTPIANALGQFSDGLRMRRTQQVEEIAAKAGVKLLFPLVFFIFPSIFVVLLGPALLGISKSINEFMK